MNKIRKMDEKNQKRLDYWKDVYGGRIVDINECRDFLEITCSRGDEITTYRVRGENGKYSISER